MGAAYLLPDGTVQLGSRYVGDIGFLYVHQVQAIDIDNIALHTGIAGLQARDGRAGSLDLEGVGSHAVLGLHPDLILQLAVESSQLKAVVL